MGAKLFQQIMVHKKTATKNSRQLQTFYDSLSGLRTVPVHFSVTGIGFQFGHLHILYTFKELDNHLAQGFT
jgi:hypothetical protein